MQLLQGASQRINPQSCDAATTYLGKVKRVVGPTRGRLTFPVAPTLMLKEHAGIEVGAMYPAGPATAHPTAGGPDQLARSNRPVKPPSQRPSQTAQSNGPVKRLKGRCRRVGAGERRLLVRS